MHKMVEVIVASLQELLWAGSQELSDHEPNCSEVNV